MTPTTTPNSNSEIGAEASKRRGGSVPQTQGRPDAPNSPAGDLLEAPALSVRRPGYWRNRWTNATGDHLPHSRGGTNSPLGDGTWLGIKLHASAELAEQAAAEVLQRIAAKANPTANDVSLRWLGAIHFPDDS
jgi:hypothetical protein